MIYQMRVQDIPRLVGIGIYHPVHLSSIDHIDLGLIAAIIVGAVSELEQGGDDVV
jgi:hypothetical protein